MKKLLPILIVVAIAASSCTLEKRHYRNGFYVSGLSKSSSGAPATPDNNTAVEKAHQQVKVMQDFSTREIESKVLVEPKETIVVSDVASQSNVSLNSVVANQATDVVHKPLVLDNQKSEKKHKKSSPDEGTGNEKSQLVAFLLCFFFGLLGIHRFYLGYVGFGLLELFTLGGFGILWLIDLFLILFGVLKPKNGNYK